MLGFTQRRNFAINILVTMLPGIVALQTIGVAHVRLAVAPPTTINLPIGFQPEGIAIQGSNAYFGSQYDGSIYRASLLNGSGMVISAGPGNASLGLKIDSAGRLFVAGGKGGNARVIDTATGLVIASYTLQTIPSYINDVWVTNDSAWFTDSTNPVLFRLPLGAGGAPPLVDQIQRVNLTGDIVYGTGANANGICATPGKDGLLIVQTNTGMLFRVNAAGKLVARISDPRFQIPTTAAAFNHSLYIPNSQFTTPRTNLTAYNVVAVPMPAASVVTKALRRERG